MLLKVKLRVVLLGMLGALWCLGCSSENDPDTPVDTDASVGIQVETCAILGEQEMLTEANMFDELPKGAEQLKVLCARLNKSKVNSSVRDAFCTGSQPKITSVKALQAALGLSFDGPVGQGSQDPNGQNGNPNWALVGHSSSLSRRITSGINPRAIIHSPSGSQHEPSPGFTVMSFVRGESFSEIITHDPDTGKLHFFLFKFEPQCSVPGNCSPTDLYSQNFESGWSNYTVYGEEDLKNTIMDCSVCHEHGLRDTPDKTPEKSLLMFELNSVWRHWLFTNKHFPNWEDNPESRYDLYMGMLQDFISAHGTANEPCGETYAGIPGASVAASRPMSLENLIEGNGYGNGFDSKAYDDTGRGLGLFNTSDYNELYALNVAGKLIQVPSESPDPTDPNKRAALIEAYQKFRTGQTGELPDLADLYTEDQLHNVGLRVKPGLTAPEIIIQACTQCHHEGLDQNVTRARFSVDLKSLSKDALITAKERINLPEKHLRAMPPHRLMTLSCDERKRVTQYLDKLIDGRAVAKDDDAPTPNPATFVLEPDALGPTSVTMRATKGIDPRGLVEYYFTETSGNDGGSDSGWQLSPTYVDVGLKPQTSYTYTVTMRDDSGIEGNPSEPMTATTLELKTANTHDGRHDDHSHEIHLECDPQKDADCDGLSNEQEGMVDTDNDGIPNMRDDDDDGDNLDTITEVLAAELYGEDPDGDGIPSWLDDDSDGDGVSDLEEGGGDYDSNGIPNYVDRYSSPLGEDQTADNVCWAKAALVDRNRINGSGDRTTGDPSASDDESSGCISAAKGHPMSFMALVMVLIGLLALRIRLN